MPQRPVLEMTEVIQCLAILSVCLIHIAVKSCHQTVGTKQCLLFSQCTAKIAESVYMN